MAFQIETYVRAPVATGSWGHKPFRKGTAPNKQGMCALVRRLHTDHPEISMTLVTCPDGTLLVNGNIDGFCSQPDK